MGEEHDLSLGAEPMQDLEHLDLALRVRLGGDLVQDQRRALVGGDQVLSHGDPQQQEDLLAGPFG